MKSLRALLLYGEDTNCELYRTLLLSERCELDEATLETYTVAAPERYCVVLLDTQRITAQLLDVIRVWQGASPDTTLIVAGSRAGQANRLAVLETGVHAYLTKPVVVPELRARIRAALRRARSQDGRLRRLALGAGTIDLDARVVRARNQEIRLTPTECGILEHLVSHANQTVPSDELVRILWGADPQKGVHSLRLFIRRLRQKLEPDPTNPRFLITEPTVGYQLKIPTETSVTL